MCVLQKIKFLNQLWRVRRKKEKRRFFICSSPYLRNTHSRSICWEFTFLATYKVTLFNHVYDFPLSNWYISGSIFFHFFLSMPSSTLFLYPSFILNLSFLRIMQWQKHSDLKLCKIDCQSEEAFRVTCLSPFIQNKQSEAQRRKGPPKITHAHLSPMPIFPVHYAWPTTCYLLSWAQFLLKSKQLPNHITFSLHRLPFSCM